MDPVLKDWQSPYHAYSNKPIIYVDPKGSFDTDYGVKPDGTIQQIGPTNNEPDRLYAINEDGSKKSEEHVTIPKGSISSINNGYYIGSDPKSKNIILKPASGIMVKNDDLAQQLFEFLTKNSKVEFGITKVFNGEGKNGINIISTSNEEIVEGESERVLVYCLSKNTPIRGHGHNHDKNILPSGLSNKQEQDGGGGIQFAKAIESQNPNAVLRIYIHSQDKYYYYNSYGLTTKPVIVLGRGK